MLMYIRKAEGGIIMRVFALLLLASNLGFCVGDKKPQKVAILGGGAASCTAALGLTGQPGWKERYNITIYQLGWRLGGKAASGRNKNYGQRLEAIAGHHFPSTFIQTKTIGGSRGGRARRAPPHLPGILVFDDILGHIV